jgi:2-polyprenyl-6-methoxyphenol hydroxylase-like FAD-dependent oxidoreductase
MAEMDPGGSSRDLVIVGGGPAGVMAGLLFARAGCRVEVLEKHEDFFRDFRGDTVHPSTMEILAQLGLLGDFLKRPHSKFDRAELKIAGRDWSIGDLTHLKTPAPYVAMMPQWEFLDPAGCRAPLPRLLAADEGSGRRFHPGRG